MIALQALIAEAVALGGGNLCASEHDWESVGGRSCPRDGTPQGCVKAGQAVYRCRRCATYDYGEAGGPGARDCARPCGTTYECLLDYDPVVYGFCEPPEPQATPATPPDAAAEGAVPITTTDQALQGPRPDVVPPDWAPVQQPPEV